MCCSEKHLVLSVHSYCDLIVLLDFHKTSTRSNHESLHVVVFLQNAAARPTPTKGPGVQLYSDI